MLSAHDNLIAQDVYMSDAKRLVNDTPSGDIVAQRITTNYMSISVVIQVNRYSWVCAASRQLLQQPKKQTTTLPITTQYYVFTVLLPMACIGYLGFAIFFFPPSDVVTRFQSIITLFLALMALQYVINDSLPASSYTLPSQQFIVATYVLYMLLTLWTFFVNKYDLTKQRNEQRSMQVDLG